MKKVLLLLAIFSAAIGVAKAETPPKGVDSTLFAYYQWCNTNRQDSNVLQKTDTLFRLSVEKNDVRMQCVAMQLKADYYYFTGNLDSLRAWIPRVQDYSRSKGQLKYYYFTWSRLILYYTKHSQYTLAQYELERYLTQAQADDYKPATADAYIQLAHIYRTKKLNRIATDYYRKAIDYIEQNDLDKFSLSVYYSALASMLTMLNKNDEALTAIERGKQCIAIPSHIWALKINELHFYTKNGQLGKAREILREIQESGKQYVQTANLLEAQLAIYNQAHEYDKALAVVNTLIKNCESDKIIEYYYAHFFAVRARILANKGNFEAAYNDQKKYTDLYLQEVTHENKSSLEEFATLFDVNRIDKEKAELQQQAQTERLRFAQSIVWGLGAILLLAGAFIAIQIRTNRKLKRAKRAAEESNHMKSNFIRSVTHEINTPLNAIVGFSELAAPLPADDEERISYIDIIRRNSTQLQKLVNDVLYISDLEAMSDAPITAPVDIGKCCRECIEKASEICPENVTLRFEPASEQFTAITSRSFLAKTLNELLSNAMQFTTAGEIILACKPDEARGQLVFTVTDTGIGVRSDNAEQIFERFFKADTFSNGMGLGLTVCRMIAQALGGTLCLDTNYTGGARFTLTIPLCKMLNINDITTKKENNRKE